MTTRRKFIKGAVSAAVAASLPVGDGVALYSIAHPPLIHEGNPVPPALLPLTNDPDTGIYYEGTIEFVTRGVKMHRALEKFYDGRPRSHFAEHDALRTAETVSR